MGCTFFINLVYSNLNSIFNILTVLMTLYRFLANKNFGIEPCEFLKILAIQTHLLTKLFLILQREFNAANHGFNACKDFNSELRHKARKISPLGSIKVFEHGNIWLL